MIVLGIETSCDECSIALVRDGDEILGHVIRSQIEEHRRYWGVVPELASRMHTEWITPVFRETLEQARLSAAEVDAVAVTNRPGLAGSLLVGVSFAKGFSLARALPLVGVDHLLAHLYAPRLAPVPERPPYPFVALLASGGHTVIAVVRGITEVEVLGGTIDDACGEAFDKIAKHFQMGYPGGPAVERVARDGDDSAFEFPVPRLKKGSHRYDVSYSGLKNAVINQRDQFHRPGSGTSTADIAASFERAAIDLLVDRLGRAVEDTGIGEVVIAGGVAANARLRRILKQRPEWRVTAPPMELCTDNGAMIAGIGYHLLAGGQRDGLDLTVSPRVPGFRRIVGARGSH